MAEVFGVDRTVITRHLKNIFKDRELDKKEVCAKFVHTTQHGAIKGKTQTRKVEHYHLDIILAVGYRINSSVAIKFRKWTTRTLKRHITKSYTIKKEVEKTLDPLKVIALLRKHIRIVDEGERQNAEQNTARREIILSGYQIGDGR